MCVQQRCRGRSQSLPTPQGSECYLGLNVTSSLQYHLASTDALHECMYAMLMQHPVKGNTVRFMPNSACLQLCTPPMHTTTTTCATWVCPNHIAPAHLGLIKNAANRCTSGECRHNLLMLHMQVCSCTLLMWSSVSARKLMSPL